MIDRETLLGRCSGEVELMKELLRDFVDRCDGERRLLVTGDEPIHRRAHKIKGLALNLSMEPLQEKAATLEAKAKEGQDTEVELRGLLETLEATCELARSILDEESDA